ncbi:3-keto-5-aminohexanoate cleavage protein [Mycobacterium sp. D16Q16]|uniref:3-keto-5-aminohexanoate cleavage protein n=1 Tax=Mycobacterium sp. D16Q16 TaxID=1855659 RepID=UPI000994600D|nr:3-keto-5-aminohexanoate cleavage protein [Mycobacterium sp. D16Q16]
MAYVKACLNGVRRKDQHPAIPCTPAEIAADAAACRDAGAGAVHVHAKDARGFDSLLASAVDPVVAAIRAQCPGLPVGVTTGAWALTDSSARCAAINAWAELPDFASVNWHEDGAAEVAETLLARGIGVEAGLWNEAAALSWSGSPLRKECFRVLLELPGGVAGTEVEEQAVRMLAQVRVAGALDVVLHGEDSSAWPVLDLAVARGVAARIGLEDTLRLPDGSLAAGNAELVAAARARMGKR